MSLLEHIADMLCLDIHLQRVLSLVDDNLVGIASFHECLEVAVRGLRMHLWRADTIAGTQHVKHDKRQDCHKIYPVHIELGHIHLWSVTITIIGSLLFHRSLLIQIRYIS